MSPFSVFLALSLLSAPLAAQEIGTAGGQGLITRHTGWDKEKAEPVTEEVQFAPRFSYTYNEGTGTKRFQWIVLTDKEPPVKSWAGVKDQAEARRLWCEKEKVSFVAVKLDAKGEVDLYFLCPANGRVNTEMVSTMNGLDSVIVTLEGKDPKRLKGTLRTGEGYCQDGEGKEGYCEQRGDFTFDAPRPAA